MAVPSVNELMNPVLRAIRSLDGIASKKQISEEIIRDMGLSPEVVNELRESGTETRLSTRLTMGLVYLKGYGVIDNPRAGTWVLTQQGKGVEEIDGREVSRQYRRRKNRQVEPIDPVAEENEGIEEIPPEDRDDDVLDVEERKPRESVEMQSLVARVGRVMGMEIWIPANDRDRVSSAHGGGGVTCLQTLPLSYGAEPLRTIEQIDVIWMKGNYIERAFEIEHTTAIYSGILRMADLMALIPNMSIKMHIVAPDYRREQVFREICRPVFRQMPSGPLRQRCTYISYDNFRELSNNPSLEYMHGGALDACSETARCHSERPV